MSAQAQVAGSLLLPEHDGLFYGGTWHAPVAGGYTEVTSPGTGERLGRVAVATAADAEPAVASARQGFLAWRDVAPLERARILKKIAAELRLHVDELAMLDAADCGNPVKEMAADVMVAAALFEFFAGLVTEMKGASIPMGPNAVNFSVREPVGVVARIVAFNHPFLFAAGKMAAPLAAGNAIIIKPPEQAPLSALRLAEIVGPLLPPGVFTVLTGGQEIGSALVGHKDRRGPRFRRGPRRAACRPDGCRGGSISGNPHPKGWSAETRCGCSAPPPATPGGRRTG